MSFVTSFILTLSTCISGTGKNFVLAKNLYNNNIKIETKADEVLQMIDEGYFIEDISEASIDIRNSLYNFEVENDLIDEETRIILKNKIDEVNQKETSGNEISDFNIGIGNSNIDNNIIGGIGANKPFNIPGIGGNNSFDNINGGGGTNDSGIFFPSYSYDEEKVKFAINHRVNGHVFLGFYASKDLCVSVYNSIAKRLTNQATKENLGIYGSLLHLISTGQDINKHLFVRVFNIFKKYIGNFFKMINFGSALTIIIEIILTVVALAAFAYFVAVFICGAYQVGFIAGFIVHDLFNWEWRHGLIDEYDYTI